MPLSLWRLFHHLWHQRHMWWQGLMPCWGHPAWPPPPPAPSRRWPQQVLPQESLQPSRFLWIRLFRTHPPLPPPSPSTCQVFQNSTSTCALPYPLASLLLHRRPSTVFPFHTIPLLALALSHWEATLGPLCHQVRSSVRTPSLAKNTPRHLRTQG